MRDLEAILEWTADHFDDRQVVTYEQTIRLAVEALRAGPELPGSLGVGPHRPGLRSLHIARGGRRGSHRLIYRVLRPGTLVVVRILHDAMDLERNLL